MPTPQLTTTLYIATNRYPPPILNYYYYYYCTHTHTHTLTLTLTLTHSDTATQPLTCCDIFYAT